MSDFTQIDERQRTESLRPIGVLALSPDELAFQLEHSEAVALIAWESFLGAATEAVARVPSVRRLVVARADLDDLSAPPHWDNLVALMGSTMSHAQEELIRKHTNATSLVLVMLDEDDAGRAGREDIARRLSRFCYVKAHQFDEPGTQPDHLSAEQVHQLMGGAS